MATAVHVDKALARKILAGDEQAFRDLFDRFFPRLYRFGLARLDGDHDAATEVVQQTFCKAFERLDTYRGEAALYSWFCQICHNTLVDYCRARNREGHKLMLIEDHQDIRAILEAVAAPVTDEPEMRAWQRDVCRLVQTTLDHLPANYGDVLEWKYIDGLSVVEIADRMGLGAKAAESLLTRARKAFREAIIGMLGSPDALQPPLNSSYGLTTWI